MAKGKDRKGTKPQTGNGTPVAGAASPLPPRTPRKTAPHPAGEALRIALIDSQFHFNQRQTHGLMIILAGMLSSDIDDAINHLNARMDPRNIRVHALDADHDPLDREEITLFPPQRRFWLRGPARGSISIFLDGWYHFLFDPARKLPKNMAAKLARRDRGELFLASERVHVMKIWLDRSEKGFTQRLKDLKKDKATRWRISDRDRLIRDDYDAYRKRVSIALDDRNTACGWTVIDMDKSHEAGAPLDRLCHVILDALKMVPARRAALELSKLQTPAHDEKAARILLKYRGNYPARERLKDPDEAILEAQSRIRKLTDSRAFADRSLVIAFEGYDAAGKGGTIRRVVRGIDPRRRNVVPIAAPNAEEMAYPYLWRFWKALPPKSDVTIFDRSWYGRVLVERVEGFASKTDWSRAYSEINDFESELVHNGVILIKLWLDVSETEQRRRFAEREDTPWKHFKITDEDWRNIGKRKVYEKALYDMLAYTHTGIAPWAVIPSDDKPQARARALIHIADRLEAALEKKK